MPKGGGGWVRLLFFAFWASPSAFLLSLVLVSFCGKKEEVGDGERCFFCPNTSSSALSRIGAMREGRKEGRKVQQNSDTVELR